MQHTDRACLRGRVLASRTFLARQQIAFLRRRSSGTFIARASSTVRRSRASSPVGAMPRQASGDPGSPPAWRPRPRRCGRAHLRERHIGGDVEIVRRERLGALERLQRLVGAPGHDESGRGAKALGVMTSRLAVVSVRILLSISPLLSCPCRARTAPLRCWNRFPAPWRMPAGRRIMPAFKCALPSRKCTSAEPPAISAARPHKARPPYRGRRAPRRRLRAGSGDLIPDWWRFRPASA